MNISKNVIEELMARLHDCAVTGCQSRREDWRALSDT